MLIMKDIFIISVGGTFEKEYYRGTGIINYGFSNKSKAEEILKLVNYKPLKVSFPKNLVKDSTEMTDLDRTRLLSILKNTHKPTVLIHGTDTMIKTAKYLAESLSKDKLIILTGATTPWINKDTDAEFNLGGAIAVAQTGIKGVFIFINGRLFNPFSCKKDFNGIFKEI
jgi:L-asparaginase